MINRKKREVKKREDQAQLERTTSGVNEYYGIGTVIALEVIGGLSYYIYQTKKGQVPDRDLQPLLLLSNHHHAPRLTSLRWIKSILYYKNGQEEYSK